MRPHCVGRRAGKQRRLANNIDDTGRRRQERLHEVEDVCLDLLALAAKQLANAVLLETFQSRDMGAVDELVDGLDKVFVELLALLLLLGPLVGVGLGVNAVNLLVVLDEGIDGVGGELKGNLIAQDHVDVDDVSLDVDELVVEEVLHGVLGHIGLGNLGQHERG